MVEMESTASLPQVGSPSQAFSPPCLGRARRSATALPFFIGAPSRAVPNLCAGLRALALPEDQLEPQIDKTQPVDYLRSFRRVRVRAVGIQVVVRELDMDRILEFGLGCHDDQDQPLANPTPVHGPRIWSEMDDFGDTKDDDFDDFDENDFDDDFDDDFEEEHDEDDEDFEEVAFDEDEELDESELTEDFDKDDDEPAVDGAVEGDDEEFEDAE